jgi:hypothetical protein
MQFLLIYSTKTGLSKKFLLVITNSLTTIESITLLCIVHDKDKKYSKENCMCGIIQKKLSQNKTAFFALATSLISDT